MNFFQRLRDRFAQFMIGRYGGTDMLGFGLLGIAGILIVVNAFARSTVLTLLEAVVLGFYLYRFFSKDIPARQKENSVYSQAALKVVRWCRNTFRHLFGDSNYKYYTCPQCHKELRVPRKKGNIEITCPQCGRSFRART